MFSTCFRAQHYRVLRGSGLLQQKFARVSVHRVIRLEVRSQYFNASHAVFVRREFTEQRPIDYNFALTVEPAKNVCERPLDTVELPLGSMKLWTIASRKTPISILVSFMGGLVSYEPEITYPSLFYWAAPLLFGAAKISQQDGLSYFDVDRFVAEALVTLMNTIIIVIKSKRQHILA